MQFYYYLLAANTRVRHVPAGRLPTQLVGSGPFYHLACYLTSWSAVIPTGCVTRPGSCMQSSFESGSRWKVLWCPAAPARRRRSKDPPANCLTSSWLVGHTSWLAANSTGGQLANLPFGSLPYQLAGCRTSWLFYRRLHISSLCPSACMLASPCGFMQLPVNTSPRPYAALASPQS